MLPPAFTIHTSNMTSHQGQSSTPPAARRFTAVAEGCAALLEDRIGTLSSPPAVIPFNDLWSDPWPANQVSVEPIQQAARIAHRILLQERVLDIVGAGLSVPPDATTPFVMSD